MNQNVWMQALRSAAAPSHQHEPLTIVHSHPHAAYSAGEHDHMHSHAADNTHDHHHGAEPGKPGAGMPTVPQANSRPPGGDARTDAELLEDARTFLARGGVDVARELRHLEFDREDEARATRNQATRLQMLAGRLARAQRDLDAELISYRNGWAGASHATVTARHDEAERLRAELLEGCCNDLDLMAAVRRRT